MALKSSFWMLWKCRIRKHAQRFSNNFQAIELRSLERNFNGATFFELFFCFWIRNSLKEKNGFWFFRRFSGNLKIIWVYEVNRFKMLVILTFALINPSDLQVLVSPGGLKASCGCLGPFVCFCGWSFVWLVVLKFARLLDNHVDLASNPCMLNRFMGLTRNAIRKRGRKP